MADEEYFRLVREILRNGVERQTRNAKTLSIFSAKLDFDMKRSFPILTTKRVFWRGVVEELLWFLRGSTDSHQLSSRGVNIWSGNSSRKFLDSIGLTNYEEGDCGPIYGYQWRHFNAPYEGCHADYTGKGIDQLAECVRLIKEDPTSRRIFMSGWNPEQTSQMCLPPCHVSYQFYVRIDTEGIKWLSCQMYMRSCDVFLGLPFNIASTALLTTIIAMMTDCKPDMLYIVIGDAHLYHDHIGAINRQLERPTDSDAKTMSPPCPKLVCKRAVTTMADLVNSLSEDYILLDYNPFAEIKASMIP